MHARCHAVSGRSRPRAQAARHVAAALSTASLTQSAPHGSPPGIVDLFVSTHPSTVVAAARVRASSYDYPTNIRSRPGCAPPCRASQSSYRRPPAPDSRARLWAGSLGAARRRRACTRRAWPRGGYAHRARRGERSSSARAAARGEPAPALPAPLLRAVRMFLRRFPGAAAGERCVHGSGFPEPRPVHVPVDGFV